MPQNKKRFWFVVSGYVDFEDEEVIKYESMPCVRVYLKREGKAELVTPEIGSYVSGVSANIEEIVDASKRANIQAGLNKITATKTKPEAAKVNDTSAPEMPGKKRKTKADREEDTLAGERPW